MFVLRQAPIVVTSRKITTLGSIAETPADLTPQSGALTIEGLAAEVAALRRDLSNTRT